MKIWIKQSNYIICLELGTATPMFKILYHYTSLFAISSKFSKQYNEILGYKWSSAWRVARILWKSVPIESMLKFCAVIKYYDVNAIEKSKSGWRGLDFLPYCWSPFITFYSYYTYIEVLPTKQYRVYNSYKLIFTLQQIYGLKI